VIIPLVKMPGIQDFVMRASLPMLFILGLTAIQILNHYEIKRRKHKVVLIGMSLLLILSWITPLSEIYKSTEKHIIRIPEAKSGEQIFTLKPHETQIYLGKLDSIFYKYLSYQNKVE